jgi:hypothetical protein
MSNLRSLIPIRGTRYYKAKDALADARLRPGALIQLVPQPDNRHDSTAVAVCLTDGTMLGYIPRERSAEVFTQIIVGHVLATRVHSAFGAGSRVEINIDVEFSTPMPQVTSSSPPARPSHASKASKLISSRPSSSSQTLNQPAPVPSKGAHTEGGIRWLWWIAIILILIWLLSK